MKVTLACWICFVSILFFGMGCTTKTGEQKKGDPQIVRQTTGINPVFDSTLLQGYWWKDEADPSALFFILGDSLYYADAQDAPYFVNFGDTTIELQQGDFNSIFALKKLTTDSLVFYDSSIGEVIKLFKKGDE